MSSFWTTAAALADIHPQLFATRRSPPPLKCHELFRPARRRVQSAARAGLPLTFQAVTLGTGGPLGFDLTNGVRVTGQ